MQGVASKHRIRGRSIGELDARDPSLINLPLPVDSIPVVGQLASPLVGDGGSGGAQPSTPPSPPPTPVSTPVGGNGSGDGGNGGGNSGGNGDGNGGGNAPTPTSGEGNPVPPGPVAPTPPNSSPGAQPSASGAKSPTIGGGVSAHPSQQGGGDFLGNVGGQTVPANAASGASSGAFGVSTPAAIATGFSSPLHASPDSSTNTVGAVASSPSVSTAAAILSGKQLSVGAVAGITIICLISLLALILLVIRRRSITHRLELRKQWWFGRNASGRPFVVSRSTRSPADSNGEAPASRLSARSSFATNFDQGLVLRVDSPSRFSLGLLPEFPPTAEVRERNSALISAGGAARRESMNSMLSSDSNPDAQYLAVSSGQHNLEPSTPMSVRPFSPSESFAFPKPPAPPSATSDSFFLAASPRPSSSVESLVHLSAPPRAFMSDVPPTSTSVSFNAQTSTPSNTLSPFVAAASPPVDPFMDPPKPEFSHVEVIRRPFTPSLDDEMAVLPNDRVRIIRAFDDGWAFVEKLASNGSERHERGLIPVDCFRDVNQALPSFLAEKRVSYGSNHVSRTAL